MAVRTTVPTPVTDRLIVCVIRSGVPRLVRPGVAVDGWTDLGRAGPVHTPCDVRPPSEEGLDIGSSDGLEDAVVVVTGASSGIGRATVEALAAAGSTVVATARRDTVLRELAARCSGAKGEVHPMPADVTDHDRIEEIARETVGRFGRLDVWVNNAGVNLYGRFEEVPLDEWRRVLEVNLLGQVHGARAAIPYFREQGRGVLVNVTSVLAKVASPLQSAYVASKFGVRGLSDSLRQELQDAPDIHVCNVMPGPIDTPLFQHAANHTGFRITAPSPTIDARRVAEAILEVIVDPEDEVGVGLNTRLGLAGNRLAPRVTDRVAAPLMAASHIDHEQAVAPTSGTLFEPMTEGAEVSGGWRSVRVARPRRTLAMAACTAAVVAAGIILRARDGR